MTLKVIGFDCFNTVFDMSSIQRDHIKGDVRRSLDCCGDTWTPLHLPVAWYQLCAHRDSKDGIAALRTKYIVATMSNGSVELLTTISKENGIDWDLVTPIELKKAYKRRPEAYLTLCELFRVKSQEVLIVTANPTLGDVEAAQALGMCYSIIRNGLSGHAKDIIDLAEKLGCF
jgi:FMN phosphatase YigB (HAD superfamily)